MAWIVSEHSGSLAIFWRDESSFTVLDALTYKQKFEIQTLDVGSERKIGQGLTVPQTSISTLARQ